jgi:hypothetical protein
MFYDLIRKAVKKPFHLLGLDLVRKDESPPPVEAAPLFDDPLEALCYVQAGKRATFKCPLGEVADRRGYGYVEDEWHPFVETLREYGANQSSCYEDSLLKKYYDTHQPDNAADAYPGFGYAPDSFYSYPPHRYRLLPWSADTPSEIDKRTEYWTERDNAEHGFPSLTFCSDGNKSHGPVSLKKGRLEYRRLTSVYDSINQEGYRKDEGYPHFQVLRRSGDYLFMPVRRKHRVAAAAALGYDQIPAIYCYSSIRDVGMVEYWPRVRNGEWTQEKSIKYVDHLFDFESRLWADKRGLSLT